MPSDKLVLRQNPTVPAATSAWTKGFAAAVREAAGPTGRLTPKKAAAMTGPYADNAQNYFAITGRSSASADRVIESGARYVGKHLDAAAGAGDRLSLAEIRTLPPDLVDDFLILRGKKPETPAAPGPTLLQAVKDASIGALSDYGKHFYTGTYPSRATRADILRDVVRYDDLSDAEVSSWFHSSQGAQAVASFASGMKEVGLQELEEAEHEDEGVILQAAVEGVGEAAVEAFLPVSKFKSVEFLEHYISEDGDTEHRVLLAKQHDGSWLLLRYENFPF